MDPINSRSLLLGCAALIVLTQIACAAWLGRQVEGYSPVDNSSELADLSERLASVESDLGDVKDTAYRIQARTGALTESMSSVARACSIR